MIRCNSNRKLTLEQRITRLENALRRNSRCKFESFESDLNEAGARAEADIMSNEFTQLNGIRLKLDKGFDTIYSMSYGWTSDLDVFNDEDDEAYFVFKYDVVGNKDISAYICPSKNGICVWSSLGDDSQCEGAVNPVNGSCGWEDDILNADAMHVPSAWKNFTLDMIHQDEDDEDGDWGEDGDWDDEDDDWDEDDDEDFESLKRSTTKRAKIESRRQLQRRNKFHR